MSTVQSIDRAFAVLRALSTGPAGVTEIAERIALPKSTVSRLLSTLDELGAVEQVSAGGDYRIGATMIELAAAARPDRLLTSLARPHLIELSNITGEAAGISIPDGSDMLYIDQLTPDSELQVRDWTGHRIPMHAVPSGQVVLAFADDFAQVVLDSKLLPFTDHTLVSTTALRKRLATVRRDGYAWCRREFADEMNSVAAGIFDADGKIVAALHVHGPASRFPGDRDPKELGMLVKSAADKIRIG